MSSNDILFSVINPAIREYRYRCFYDSLSVNNKTSFEIVFAGNNCPRENMPDNFRYIHTNVKPAQCLEIAARNSRGEYLLTAGDDLLFSDQFLNKMALYVDKFNDRKVIVTARYSLKKVIHDDYLTFDPIFKESPIVGIVVAFKKKIWQELGGIDRRFVSCFGCVDMQMRFYEKGYTLFIAPDCIADEVAPDSMKTLFRRTGRTDRITFNSFWMDSDGISKKRLDRVMSFDDNNIYNKTQGNNEAFGKSGSQIWA